MHSPIVSKASISAGESPVSNIRSSKSHLSGSGADEALDDEELEPVESSFTALEAGSKRTSNTDPDAARARLETHGKASRQSPRRDF